MNFTDKNETITFHAGWKTNTYYIAFKGGTGTSGSMNNMTMEYTKSKSLTNNIFIRTGYRFDNWSGSDGKTYENGQEVINLTTTNGATVNMTSNWSADTYTVTFNGNGKATPSQSTKTVTYDSTYGTLPTINANGYSFKGWHTEASNGSMIESTTKVTKTANHTIYAQWTANTYNITYNLNGGTQGSGAVNTYNIETATFNLPTPTRSLYNFIGWYTENSGGSRVTNIPKGSTGNKTYYARWELADTENPTCVINVGTTGITLTTDDDTSVAGYDLTTSTTATYSNKDSLTLATGTYYGYVRDSARKTGNCSRTITNTTKACADSNYTLGHTGDYCYLYLGTATVTYRCFYQCTGDGGVEKMMEGPLCTNPCTNPGNSYFKGKTVISSTCAYGSESAGYCYYYKYDFSYNCPEGYTTLNDTYCYK